MITGRGWSGKYPADFGSCKLRQLIAAQCTTELRIAGAQVALLIMRYRLILMLFGQRMCNAMRRAAELNKQQSEDEQKADDQRALHGADSIRFQVCPSR